VHTRSTILCQMSDFARFNDRTEPGSGYEARRQSVTTKAVNNHEGMDELKQCKTEWMNRLEDTNADFEDIIDARDHLFERFSLNAFVDTTMATLNRSSAARIKAATPTPQLDYSPTKQAVVRRRPHSIEPLPKHRLKITHSHLPAMNVNFNGSGKMRSSMTHYARKAQPGTHSGSKDFIVVTGKVDYGQLKAEQKALNAKTEASDEQYRDMMREFEQFKHDVARRFSLLLHEPAHMITGAQDQQQNARMLVTVPDRVWNKMDMRSRVGEAADAL